MTDPAGDEIISTDAQFATDFVGIVVATGHWTATFTVPAGFSPGERISVGAVCTQQAVSSAPETFEYLPAVFRVAAAPTTGGGTTTGVTAIPPGGGGNTLVSHPAGGPATVQRLSATAAPVLDRPAVSSRARR